MVDSNKVFIINNHSELLILIYNFILIILFSKEYISIEKVKSLYY